MARFNDDWYDGEEFPNQTALWNANIERSIKGKKGQAVLRDLREALLELPQPRLINGYIAAGNEVCAVGALVLKRRVSKGEARGEVLKELERLVKPYCECSHSIDEHEDGTGHCTFYSKYSKRGCWDACEKFRLDPEEMGDEFGADVTASVGTKVGVTYSLAWRIASLNDQTFGNATPEERWQKMMEWIDKNLEQPVAGHA